MARKARIKSSTGIYHVLVRAISDLSLFTDDEDTKFYTDILNDLQLQGRCEVYAYALFPTHVHLLIKEGFSQKEENTALQVSSLRERTGGEAIGTIMKRIAAAYSYFFNVKYDHYGPIYLGRFKSNPVETKDYFLKVLDHIGSQQAETKYTCRHIPSGLVSAKPNDNSHRSASASSSFPPLLDYKERSKRITDSKLLAFLQQNYSFTNIGEFLQRPDVAQEEAIRNCKREGGSIRQIVRLTGNSFAQVFKVKV